MCLRDDKPTIPYPDCWDPLGGSMEKGETPEQCITREIQEEIGITISLPNIYKVLDLDDRIEHIFWQRADFDIGKIDLQEGQQLQWFSREEIEALPSGKVSFNFKPIILKFFEEKPFI